MKSPPCNQIITGHPPSSRGRIVDGGDQILRNKQSSLILAYGGCEEYKLYVGGCIQTNDDRDAASITVAVLLDAGGLGAVQRALPIGGAAYRMEDHSRTPFDKVRPRYVVPSVVTAN